MTAELSPARSAVATASLLASIGLGAIALAPPPPLRSVSCFPPPLHTATRLQGLHDRAITWLLAHHAEGCPHIRELPGFDGYDLLDSWSNPITLACDASSHPYLRSFGADGLPGTADDLVVR